MLEIIGNILYGSLYASLGLSTIITFLNNSCSNSRIKRKGFEIKPITNNSVVENIIYFIKDYGFIAVPFYNLFHSIKQTAKKNSEYDTKRMEVLEDRDRLVKVEDKKVEKTSPAKKSDTEEETRKEDKKRAQRISLEEMSCYERREFYKNNYYRLLALRNKCKQEGKSVEILNEISHRMQPIVDEYKKADRECKLEDLKAEKNAILQIWKNQ